MNERHLRIGDADRERAAAALGEHFAEGRLSADEHAERFDAVWTARTAGDLEPLFEDLPRQPATLVPRSGSGPRRPAAPARWLAGVPLLPVTVLLVALSVITGWPLWLVAVLLWWGRARARHDQRQRLRQQRWAARAR